MRRRDRELQAMRRISRAEADCNATILRAFSRVLRVLEREKTEWTIFLDRERRKVRRGR